jgi:hypothetical protein
MTNIKMEQLIDEHFHYKSANGLTSDLKDRFVGPISYLFMVYLTIVSSRDYRPMAWNYGSSVHTELEGTRKDEVDA